jgi:hypothetical protein
MKRSPIAFCMLALAGMVWAAPTLADPGRGSTTMCYLWANNPSPAINTPYEPSATYSYNAQNRAGGISVTKTATGVYSVKCTGVGGGPWGAGGHVQVSAYGSGSNTQCHVGGWGTGGADFTASVYCYAPSGAPRDSYFDLLFVW